MNKTSLIRLEKKVSEEYDDELEEDENFDDWFDEEVLKQDGDAGVLNLNVNRINDEYIKKYTFKLNYESDDGENSSNY